MKLYKSILILIVSVVLLSACQPDKQPQASEDATSYDNKAVEENTIEEGQPVNKLFVDEIYGFYFALPDSWTGYEAVYIPENPKTLGEDLTEGQDLAFGAKKMIQFKVNDELIIEFYIVPTEKWAEVSANTDGPLPYEIGSSDVNVFSYSVNQGVQSPEAKKALDDFVKTIENTFGLS